MHFIQQTLFPSYLNRWFHSPTSLQYYLLQTIPKFPFPSCTWLMNPRSLNSPLLSLLDYTSCGFWLPAILSKPLSPVSFVVPFLFGIKRGPRHPTPEMGTWPRKVIIVPPHYPVHHDWFIDSHIIQGNNMYYPLDWCMDVEREILYRTVAAKLHASHHVEGVCLAMKPREWSRAETQRRSHDKNPSVGLCLGL